MEDRKSRELKIGEVRLSRGVVCLSAAGPWLVQTP